MDIIFGLLVTLASFIVLLSFIVFFHELGHFQVARWCGVKVDVFSIGFGPVLLRRTDRQGTEWRISALPLGGFVKFFGDAGPASAPSSEVNEEKSADNADSSDDTPGMTQFPKGSERDELEHRLTAEEKAVCFHFKPLWQRAAIVAAGPMANFVLAIAIFFVLLMSLGETVREARIVSVEPDSPAAIAGFEPGDKVLSVEGKRVRDWTDLTQAVKLGTGEELDFEVERNNSVILLRATPERREMLDRYGNTVSAGFLGVSSTPEFQNVRYGPLEAMGKSIARVGDMIGLTVKFLGRIILGKEDFSQLGGPVKIAKYAGQSTMSGFDEAVPEEVSLGRRLLISLVDFVQMAAMISISVGFLNLLPVPVLDGGHLVFYAYEAIAGKPLSEAVQAFSFRIGIVILLFLMVFVTWNDISQEFLSKLTG
ncbi:RIP metalloprotease [Parvularcula sp. IMCC14364]|uniref:M50 family metallopeptidase n=1 Tax=Parvularcula sp. IMCC14364 TaxID=3067902 RepID=UPI002741399C|nr:site-2 protease family protein [Parvularcula sp. IMCC14364]